MIIIKILRKFEGVEGEGEGVMLNKKKENNLRYLKRKIRCFYQSKLYCEEYYGREDDILLLL